MYLFNKMFHLCLFLNYCTALNEDFYRKLPFIRIIRNFSMMIIIIITMQWAALSHHRKCVFVTLAV